MESILALKIAKYYKKENNKIIFANGMTLNKMALEMWERLNFSEVDPSVVSRVINGQRLFTPSQLKVFCKVLKIKSKEQENLNFCLAQDLTAKFGLSLNFPLNFNEYCEQAENELERIMRIEHLGEISFSGEWVLQLQDRLKSKLSEANGNWEEKQKILAILIRTIIRRLNIFNQQMGKNQITRDYRLLILELEGYVAELKDPDYLSIPDYEWGYYYYFLDNYQESLSHLKKSNNNSKFLLKEKLYIARTTSLNFAYLGDNYSFEKAKKDVLAIEKDDSYSSQLSSAYEGLARAEAILDNKNYQKTLDKAWDGYEMIKEREDLKLLRKIQLVRTEIEIYAYKKRPVPCPVQHLGLETIKEAEEYGFNRYAEKIKNLLVCSPQATD
jgi:hypothetical protein